MSTTHYTQDHAVRTVSKAHVLSGLHKVIDTFRTWADRAAKRRELRELLTRDTRLFQDIGLYRHEIAREAFKPFWRA